MACESIHHSTQVIILIKCNKQTANVVFLRAFLETTDTSLRTPLYIAHKLIPGNYLIIEASLLLLAHNPLAFH